MAQGERQSPPFEHGQESGFGTLEQVPQDPSDPAGYQQIERDTVERMPRGRGWLRRIPLPLLLLAGLAIPLAVLFVRRRRSP
jgi:hypothetical protein